MYKIGGLFIVHVGFRHEEMRWKRSECGCETETETETELCLDIRFVGQLGELSRLYTITFH